MAIQFLNRIEERRRIARALNDSESSLVCVYGRRRVGKSRLLIETMPSDAVYYCGTLTEPPMQRRSLARAVADRIPGFDKVEYPDWDSLFERWQGEGGGRSTLVLDEFPYLEKVSPELPSVIQKAVDRKGSLARHIVLCGSSQRMMLDLFDGNSAPLFGRARETIRVSPLEIGWIREAFGAGDPRATLDAYAAWGGIPRYWELARNFKNMREALVELVLDPLGQLHTEPQRLLSDDLRDTVQSSSILALAGQGVNRMSEMASRLSMPATSVTRPLRRLLELGLLTKEIPFGESPRDTKKALYKISDPLTSLWYRFVEPNLSRLEMRRIGQVSDEIDASWDSHAGHVWESVCRRAVSFIDIAGTSWNPASRWWGAGLDRRPVEFDVVAESVDGGSLLVGEAKLSSRGRMDKIESELVSKIERFPLAAGKKVVPCVFILKGEERPSRKCALARGSDVLDKML